MNEHGTVLGPPTGSSGKSIRRCQGCMGLDFKSPIISKWSPSREDRGV